MLKIILILLCGAGLGALMGHFGKCESGGCPLTANPWRGALWGLFLAGIAIYPMIVNALRKPVPESESIIHISSEKEILDISKQKPVILDFYADWCGGCRAIAPLINNIAEEYKGTAAVIKVNVDKHKDVAQKYMIQMLPTVILIYDGKEVKRLSNPSDYNEYTEILKPYLEK
jgi:thioredoxin 1